MTTQRHPVVAIVGNIVRRQRQLARKSVREHTLTINGPRANFVDVYFDGGFARLPWLGKPGDLLKLGSIGNCDR